MGKIIVSFNVLIMLIYSQGHIRAQDYIDPLNLSQHSHQTQTEIKFLLKNFQDLGKNLKTNLTKQVNDHGLLKAMQFCHLNASVIADDVMGANSSELLRFGRVSLKNRHKNQHLHFWMKKMIKQSTVNNDEWVALKVRKAPLGSGNDYEIRLMKPIRTTQECLGCHGSQIDQSVKDYLKLHYPKDKALGYKIGDIRGYFWAISKSLKE